MSQVPYQLLELTVISAQDLAPAKNLRTYAVTWIKPERKLRTGVDTQGRNNPTWNDKFVFRIDEKFLDSETSFVIIEIYATGWIKDSLIGSVRVMISNLIPPSVRQEKRFVALQIRRPSGRPQGILNMGVSLLDNTMRSMPLCTEFTGSTVGFRDLWDGKKGENDGKEKKQTLARLLRSLSDKTDLTTKQGEQRKKKIGSVCNGSLLQYGPGSIAATGAGLGSVIDNVFRGGAVNAGGGGGGSMVNGSVCNSDVGPSASVVAAAVAMGLYPLHQGPAPRPGSSVLEDWTVEESPVEGLKTRIDRWRMDLPPGYERLEDANEKDKEKKWRHQRRHRRMPDDEEEDDGRFTCFGNALGFEFKIVCGGGKNIKKKAGSKKK